jgi:photosystem II stability/assembly factor-like uncharacterized protein
MSGRFYGSPVVSEHGGRSVLAVVWPRIAGRGGGQDAPSSRARLSRGFGAFALFSIAASAVAGPAAEAVRGPLFQPASVAFLDQRQGVLGEEDWSCGRASGCPARILVSSDGGASWQLSLRVTAPVRLYPVRGTRVVWASTGTSVIESSDAGKSWRRVRKQPAAAIAFATPADGWLLQLTTGRNGWSGRLLATSDGGRSWRRLTDPCHPEWFVTEAFSLPTSQQGWLVCVSEGGTGSQGKEVWATGDGGHGWTLRARTRFVGAPNEHVPNVGNLPLFGYPAGISFLPEGHGWLWEGRGWLLTTTDGGRVWRKLPITQADTTAAQSADLLNDLVGFVLLRGCSVRLVRTSDGGQTWATVKRWPSPTRCRP